MMFLLFQAAQQQISPFEVYLLNTAMQVFNWLVIAAIIFLLRAAYEGVKAIRLQRRREQIKAVERDKAA